MFLKAGFIFLKNAGITPVKNKLNRRFLKNALIYFLILFPIILFSQEKIIGKANTAYKYKQYAQAAKLYEIVIAEKEETKKKSGLLPMKMKLANCYRMNNKMDKAETIYAEVVQNDRAKYDTYLYYGETLMSNGKYDEAKKWFLEYQKVEPDNGQGAFMAANCDKVKLIKPYFSYLEIQPFAHNSDADDNAPIAWQNGLVFSSDRKQGVKLMKEKSGWTGRDYLDLYFSVINEDSTYSEPKRFSSKLSEVNKNTGNASFSVDGKEVYFTRNDNILNKRETYNLQLFRAINNRNGKWKKVEKLSFCSPNNSYMHPAISPDGSELFFATDRKGEGGTDLWVSKSKGDDWGKPANLGSVINTSANEGFPFMDKNGRLYFCSKGHPSYGGFDIFFSERGENGNWQTPRNLGQPINSPLDDISFYLNADDKNGMLSSSREGGDDDIYFFKVIDKMPERQPLAAINPNLEETPSRPIVNKKPGGSEQPAVGKTEVETDVVFNQKKLNVSQKKENELNEIVNTNLEKNEVIEPAFEEHLKIDSGQEIINNEEIKTTIKIENEPIPFSQIKENELVVIQPDSNTNKKELIAETTNQAPPLSNAETTITSVNETVSGSEKPISKTLPDDSEVKGNQPPVYKNQLTRNKRELAIDEKNNLNKTNQLLSFQQLIDRSKNNELTTNQVYKIDGATFDENVWQLTPKIAKRLNSLVTVLRKYPDMQIEINAYTESLGLAEKNLELSKNRMNMAVEYILREGIAKDRITGNGFGETNPLNHCKDGVTCSMEEHRLNQRFEVKIKL